MVWSFNLALNNATQVTLIKRLKKRLSPRPILRVPAVVGGGDDFQRLAL
jgi:hypothetical protein